MKQNCQHCGELIVGNAYRVRSEEAGITLLDMIVCSLCSMEAKKLRLRTQKLNVTSKHLSARTRGTYPFTTRYLI
jgi:ribosome-binding protein aMBF1 (putative translation factor)